jgi:hypothetical protein
MIAGRTGDREIGPAGMHERHEWFEQPAGLQLPVAVGGGDGRIHGDQEERS